MARLTYNDCEPMLKEMYEMLTGRKAVGSLNFGQMQSVFKTALVSQNDNLYNIIPTVLTKTLFAVRPYNRKFAGAFWTQEKYGDWTRKFTPIVENYETNDEWNIPTELAKAEASQDWKAGTKPIPEDVLMTVTNGGNSYAKKYTIFKNQLNAAFDSEQGVADFFSMKMTEFSNGIELDGENEVRTQIANIILTLADAGKSTPTAGNACGKDQCWHVLSEYNAETGLAMTAKTVMLPANFREFMIWFSARYQDKLSDLAVHSIYHHANLATKKVNRHTNMDRMRVYISKRFAEYFKANGAALFNPDKLTLGDYEEVNYWTDINNKEQVNGVAKCLKTDGTELSLATAKVDNVIGLVTDVDMFGIVPIDIWSASEPFNARFGFRNVWNHYTWKQQTDFTENALLICLD